MNFQSVLPDWLPPWLAASLLGAGAGILAASWGYLRNLLASLSTHLIDVVKVDADLAAELLTSFGRTGKTSQFGGRGYTVISRFVRSKARQRWILARWLDKEGRMTFWMPHKLLRKAPLWVDRGKDGHQMTFRFLRGTLDFESRLRSIVDRVNSQKENRYKIHRLGSVPSDDGHAVYNSGVSTFTAKPATSFYLTEDPDDVGEALSQGGPDDLWLHPDVRHVLDDARRWFSARAWYNERRIPWRRGFMFHGKPGTGKTSLARAIAIDLDLPVYTLDLQSMNNTALASAFETARQDAPCMLLMEDIDSVYKARTPLQANKHTGTPPSFDLLLNQIQGVSNNDGLLVVLTTNRLETIDCALGGPAVQGTDGKIEVSAAPIPRPGRIDKLLKTPDHIDEEGRRQLAARMLPARAVEPLVAGTAGLTAAQFHEELLQYAQAAL